MITGATSGMGKAAALNFAQRGARVVLACRDLELAKKVVKEIQDSCDNINVNALHCDLSSMESIHSFVEEFKKLESQLHILVNNAAVMMCPKTLTEDKFEMQFGVNYLGHFLLTHLLLDHLKKSAPSRIINMTAHAHQLGVIDFDDINQDNDYNPGHAYAQSKLAIALFTVELAEQLEGTDVTVNCVNPGIVNTKLHRHMPFRNHTFITLCFMPFVWYLFKKPEDGINSVLFAALDDSLEQTSGKYITECAFSDWCETVKNEDVRKKLWEESLKWTKVSYNS